MRLIESMRIREIAKLDMGIHTPARLMIIMALSGGDAVDCVQLSRLTELSWGNLSSHLNKLEESGYIRMTKSWIGKKPNTRVELTEIGSQAYAEWGKTILMALPSQINTELLFVERPQIMPEHVPFLPGQVAGDADARIAASNDSTHILWFLPSDHRWERVLPPMENIHQVL